jgi:hypothetical protein
MGKVRENFGAFLNLVPSWHDEDWIGGNAYLSPDDLSPKVGDINELYEEFRAYMIEVSEWMPDIEHANDILDENRELRKKGFTVHKSDTGGINIFSETYSRTSDFYLFAMIDNFIRNKPKISLRDLAK